MSGRMAQRPRRGQEAVRLTCVIKAGVAVMRFEAGTCGFRSRDILRDRSRGPVGWKLVRAHVWSERGASRVLVRVPRSAALLLFFFLFFFFSIGQQPVASLGGA